MKKLSTYPQLFTKKEEKEKSSKKEKEERNSRLRLGNILI
jgi:hypothetical protein